MTTLLTDEVKAWIGSKVAYTAPDPVSRAAIRYYARSIGDDNPVYYDDVAARQAGFSGIVAPPTMICDSIQYMDGERDSDGYIGHIWRLPVGSVSRFRGGAEYSFHRPLEPNDIVTAIWTLESIVEKYSRTGEPWLLATSLVQFLNQNEDIIAESRETTIYRPKKRTSLRNASESL